MAWSNPTFQVGFSLVYGLGHPVMYIFEAWVHIGKSFNPNDLTQIPVGLGRRHSKSNVIQTMNTQSSLWIYVRSLPFFLRLKYKLLLVSIQLINKNGWCPLPFPSSLCKFNFNIELWLLNICAILLGFAFILVVN